MFRDRQSKPGATASRRSGRVRPVETFCESWDMYRINADATVLHREDQAVILAIPAYFNRPFSRSVFNSVQQDIREGALQLGFVTIQGFITV